MEELEHKWITVPVFPMNIWDFCISKRYKVSVLIRVHHGAEWLDLALQSILRQEPNFNYEIVIVDDASANKGVEQLLMHEYKDLMHSKKIKYIKICTRLGFYKPRAILAAAADGEIIIMQDQKVMQFPKDAMQRLVDGLGENVIATFAGVKFTGRTPEDVRKVNWRNWGTKELLGKVRKLTYQEPWFTLGAIRRQNYWRVTAMMKNVPPFQDSSFAISMKRLCEKENYTFKGLGEEVIAIHLAHPGPQTALDEKGEKVPKPWWGYRKEPM